MKLAWFQGDAQEPHWTGLGSAPSCSQDALNAFAEQGETIAPRLRILLVPDHVDLRTLGGDDWNDAPASHNASEPYDVPEGSVWFDLPLGARVSLAGPV